MEGVEGGVESTVVEAELLQPSKHTTAWSKCHVVKNGPTFVMYTENSGRFVMAGYQVGDEFRISQNEAFTKVHDPSQQNSGQTQPDGRYVAVVRRMQGRAAFELLSFGCQNCDDRLGRYTCNPLTFSAGREVTGGGDEDAQTEFPRSSFSFSSQQITDTMNAAAEAATAAAAPVVEFIRSTTGTTTRQSPAMPQSGRASPLAPPAFVTEGSLSRRVRDALGMAASSAGGSPRPAEPALAGAAATRDDLLLDDEPAAPFRAPRVTEAAPPGSSLLPLTSASTARGSGGLGGSGTWSGSGTAGVGYGYAGDDGGSQSFAAGFSSSPSSRIASEADALRRRPSRTLRPLQAPASSLDVTRQKLCEIVQRSERLPQAGVDIRCLSVILPRVYEDFSRAVWCPKNLRGSGVGVSPRLRRQSRLGYSSGAASCAAGSGTAGSGDYAETATPRCSAGAAGAPPTSGANTARSDVGGIAASVRPQSSRVPGGLGLSTSTPRMGSLGLPPHAPAPQPQQYAPAPPRSALLGPPRAVAPSGAGAAASAAPHLSLAGAEQQQQQQQLAPLEQGAQSHSLYTSWSSGALSQLAMPIVAATASSHVDVCEPPTAAAAVAMHPAAGAPSAAAMMAHSAGVYGGAGAMAVMEGNSLLTPPPSSPYAMVAASSPASTLLTTTTGTGHHSRALSGWGASAHSSASPMTRPCIPLLPLSAREQLQLPPPPQQLFPPLPSSAHGGGGGCAVRSDPAAAQDAVGLRETGSQGSTEQYTPGESGSFSQRDASALMAHELLTPAATPRGGDASCLSTPRGPPGAEGYTASMAAAATPPAAAGHAVLALDLLSQTPSSSAIRRRSVGACSSASSQSRGTCPERENGSNGSPVGSWKRGQAQHMDRGSGRDCNDAMLLVNRMPEWNEGLSSLTMKFLGSRIGESSSKNFLLELVEPAPPPQVTTTFVTDCSKVMGGGGGPPQTARASADQESSSVQFPVIAGEGGSSFSSYSAAGEGGKRVTPCLQFGKMRGNRFSCDFRYPIAPIQALGIFLSSFAWVLKADGPGPQGPAGGGSGRFGAEGAAGSAPRYEQDSGEYGRTVRGE